MNADVMAAAFKLSGIAINVANAESRGTLTADALEQAIADANNALQVMALEMERRRHEESKP